MRGERLGLSCVAMLASQRDTASARSGVPDVLPTARRAAEGDAEPCFFAIGDASGILNERRYGADDAPPSRLLIMA